MPAPKIADCAPCDWGVELALSYLPPDVLQGLEGKLTIVSTVKSDGFRVAKKTRENCEIIGQKQTSRGPNCAGGGA